MCHPKLIFSYITLGDIMITLSIAMIVKNEHNTLSRCLECAKQIADEIIIVDTGSTDDTKEIALKYTDKIYDFKWVDDFSKARNFAFSKATMEYIMWLDADDVILKEDISKLKTLKNILTKDIDMIMLKYNLNLDENGVPSLSYYRERIVKRTKNYKWISPIHEVIPRSGKVIFEDIAITHKKLCTSYSDRNLKIFEKMKNGNYPFDARQTFYYARELMYAKRYEESLEEYNRFLNLPNAWIENKISASLDLYDIYHILGDNENAILSLFNSFKYSLPRAEVCCKIGWHFISNKEWKIAIYWLNAAINCTYDISSGGFFSPDYYNFIPYINLGFCYYNLGNIDEAIHYNELAGKIKPCSSIYLDNKKVYEKQKEG